MEGSKTRPYISFYWLSLLLLIAATLTFLKLYSRSLEMQSPSWACRICGAFAVILVIFTAGFAVKSWPRKRPFIFSNILAIGVFFAIALCVCIGGRLLSPPWPNRELRPVLLNINTQNHAQHVEDFGPNSNWNSWGQRDLERSVQKQAGIKRIVFIGDSFLEGGFCTYPLSLLTQKLLNEKGRKDIECINLGVSGTGPVHYYYRQKEIGEGLSPDAIVLMIYSGNDFLEPTQAYKTYSQALQTMYFNERPLPSVLGSFLPEFDWVLTNRLSMSEMARSQKAIPNEQDLFKKLATLPPAEALEKATAHMHEYYHPQLKENQIKEILGRGGEKFWKAFTPKEKDQEYIQSWILNNMIGWEIGAGKYPNSIAAIAPDQITPHVESTLSWIAAIADRCEERHLPLTICVAPTGIVDPGFQEFWKPWPRYFSWNYFCQARHMALVSKLKEKKLNVFDLSEVLKDVPDTYRKSDAHWNEKGHAVVAQALCERFLSQTSP